MFLARHLLNAASGRIVAGKHVQRSEDGDEEVDLDSSPLPASTPFRNRVSSNVSAVSSYSTDSSATHATRNSDNERDSEMMFGHAPRGNDQTIDDPEAVIKSHLANAWFQKRALMKSEPTVAASSLYGDAIVSRDRESHSGPVDLDEEQEAYFDSIASPQQLDEGEEQSAVEDSDASAFSSSSSEGDELGLENLEWSSYDSLRGRNGAPSLTTLAADSSILSSANAHLLFIHYNECDRASIVSASTSDMTPIACNRSPDVSPTRQSQLQSGGNLDDILELPLDKTRWTFRDFCNYRTYQGKVALLLVVILILAVVTIVVSSTQVNQKSRVGDANNNATDSSTAYVSRPTAAPSSIRSDPSPSLPPGSGAPTTVVESPAPAFSAPSISPTVEFEEMSWQTIQTIVEPTQLSGTTKPAQFGSAVALSANAKVLVAAARDATINGQYGAGLVQVFGRVAPSERSTASWILRASFAGRSSQYGTGSAVAVSEDGALVALGEPGNDLRGDRSGSVRTYQFDEDSGDYIPVGQELFGPGTVSFFGASLAMSGNRLVVGAPAASDSSTRQAGMVQVYELAENGTEWQLLSTVFGTDESDSLGSAVDITGDGLVVVASAPENSSRKGYVRVLVEVSGQWKAFGDIVNDIGSSKSGERFGHSLSVSPVEGADGSYRLAVGSPHKSISATKDMCGAVLVYDVSFTSDQMQALLLGDEILGDRDDKLGYSLKLVQGRFLTVASPGTNQRRGRVQLYHYHLDSKQWNRADQQFEGLGDGDNFGFSVALAPDSQSILTLAVGAIYSNSSGTGPGYVTVFEQR